MSAGLVLSILIISHIYYPEDLNYPVYYPHYYVNFNGYYTSLPSSPWEKQQIREVKRITGELTDKKSLILRMTLVGINYCFTPTSREIIPFMVFARHRGILLQNFLIFYLMKFINNYKLQREKGYIFADLHLHSFYSHDSISNFEATVIDAYKKGIRAIVVSDHDFSYPYFQNKLERLKKEGKVGRDFILIPAEEVTTRNGHLLALFINQRLYPGLTLEETINEINKKGGLAILPHLNLYTTGAGFNTLKLKAVQGLEILNGGNFLPYNVHQNMKFLWTKNIHAFGSSDAHISDAVGLYVTKIYLGDMPPTLASIKKAILDGEYEPFIPSEFMRWYVETAEKLSPFFKPFDYYFSLKLKLEMLLSKIFRGEVRFWLNIDRSIYYIANFVTIPLGYRLMKRELGKGVRIEEIYWEKGPLFFYFKNGEVREYRIGIYKVF